MQLGIIGIGRMGGNMARRLVRGGHACVVYNRSSGPVEELVKDTEPLPGAGLGAALKAREDLASVLRDLPDSERNVLGWRFGLSGEAPMTLEAIGRKLGVTRERVRQIESAALERVRRLMAARGMEAQDLF